MHRSRKPYCRLTLEGLEDRLAPANIRLAGGNLFISDQTGFLLVRTTATPGEIEVIDAGESVTVGDVDGRIAITGTNGGDSVTFQANAGEFGGDLVFDMGDGLDGIVIQASATGGIGGDVRLRPGAGNDTTAITAATRIGGSLHLTDPSGNNVFAGLAPITVEGYLTTTGVSAFSSTASLSVADDLTVSPSPGSTGFIMSLNGTTTIGRNLNVTSRDADNAIAMLGTANVAGNVNLRLGPTNSVFIAPTVQLAGNLSVSGGSGGNFLTFLGTVGGAVTVHVGNGSNGTIVGGLVMGAIHYRGGNGSESLIIAPVVPTTVVADVTFGSGTATFLLTSNVTLTGRVGGTGGTYTFVQGGATLGSPLKLINFP